MAAAQVPRVAERVLRLTSLMVPGPGSTFACCASLLMRVPPLLACRFAFDEA